MATLTISIEIDDGKSFEVQKAIHGMFKVVAVPGKHDAVYRTVDERGALAVAAFLNQKRLEALADLKLIEVTSGGETKTMALATFYKLFGKDEGKEILAGHLPHITAIIK